MVGFCHLTDSHHYHHGQKPTMVGICHGGNMLGNHHHHRNHRQYHHHLVARHVVMHQVRGIGMMQYITKMMKTKYLGGFSVIIQ